MRKVLLTALSLIVVAMMSTAAFAQNVPAAAPTPTPVPAAVTPAPEATAAPVAAAPTAGVPLDAPKPVPLVVQPGKVPAIEFAGFGQVWYTYLETGACAAGKCTQSDNSLFKVQRARLVMKGVIPGAEFLSYFGQIDYFGGPELSTQGATSGTLNLPIMLDFWINAKIVGDYLQLKAGEMLIPFGYEPPRSPYDLELITYSLVYGAGMKYAGTQLGFFPYLRDMGVQIHGEAKFNGGHGINYKVGIFNGQGLYQQDIITLGGNRWKDFMGRIGYSYRADAKNDKALRADFGVSGYYGDQNLKGDVSGNADFKKWRSGVDLRIDWNNLLFAAEYLVGIPANIATDDKNFASKVNFKAYGAYAMLGYAIIGKVQPVIRYDIWSQETAHSPTKYYEVQAVTAGINYLFCKNAKVSIVYEQMFPNGLAKGQAPVTQPNGSTTPVSERQLIVQLAARF